MGELREDILGYFQLSNLETLLQHLQLHLDAGHLTNISNSDSVSETFNNVQTRLRIIEGDRSRPRLFRKGTRCSFLHRTSSSSYLTRTLLAAPRLQSLLQLREPEYSNFQHAHPETVPAPFTSTVRNPD